MKVSLFISMEWNDVWLIDKLGSFGCIIIVLLKEKKKVKCGVVKSVYISYILGPYI